MTVYKEDPPCTECSGGCCISYDVIALTSDEVKYFGVPHILIGSDGCQYLEKGVAPFTMKDHRDAELGIVGMLFPRERCEYSLQMVFQQTSLLHIKVCNNSVFSNIYNLLFVTR